MHFYLSLGARKPVFGVFDQVRHKHTVPIRNLARRLELQIENLRP